MFKKISSASNFGVIETENSKELISVTSNNKVVSFKYDPENFVYFRCRAITADVPNANADYFPEEEIKKSYKTFIGVGLYKDHNADSVSKAIGKILWAEYIPEGKYVELIGCIDKKLDPDTARRVTSGIIDSCSMGCSVTQSVCSICGNVAYSPKEYCEHINPINGMKGRILADGKMVYEINKGIQFTELSLVTSPADKTARLFEVVASAKKNNDSNKKPGMILSVDEFFENSKKISTFDKAIELYQKIKDNAYGIVSPVSNDYILDDKKKQAISKMLQFFFALNHPIYKLAFHYRNLTESEVLKNFGDKIDSALKNIILGNLSADVEKDKQKNEDNFESTFSNEFQIAVSILNANGIFSPFPVTSDKRRLFLRFANYASPNQHFYFYKNYLRNGLFITLPGLMPYIRECYNMLYIKNDASEQIFNMLENLNRHYYSLKSIENKNWVNNEMIHKKIETIYNELDKYFSEIGYDKETKFDSNYIKNMVLSEYSGFPKMCVNSKRIFYKREVSLKNILDFVAKFKVLLASDRFSNIWDNSDFNAISGQFDNLEKEYIFNFGMRNIKDEKLKKFYDDIRNMMFKKSRDISIEKIKSFLPTNFGISLNFEDINYSLLADSVINVDFLGLLNYSRYYNRINDILLEEDAKKIQEVKSEDKRSPIPRLNTIHTFLSGIGNKKEYENEILRSTIEAIKSDVEEYYIDVENAVWMSPIEKKYKEPKIQDKKSIIKELIKEQLRKMSDKNTISFNIGIMKNIYDILKNNEKEIDKDIVENIIKDVLNVGGKTIRMYYNNKRKALDGVKESLSSISNNINNIIRERKSYADAIKKLLFNISEINGYESFLKNIISDLDVRENYLGYPTDFVEWLNKYNIGFGLKSKSYKDIIDKCDNILKDMLYSTYNAIAYLSKISGEKAPDTTNRVINGPNILDRIIFVGKKIHEMYEWASNISEKFLANTKKQESSVNLDQIMHYYTKLYDALSKSIPKDIGSFDNQKMVVIKNELNKIYEDINKNKKHIEVKVDNTLEKRRFNDFLRLFVENIVKSVSPIAKYFGDISIVLEKFKKMLIELDNDLDKKSSLYLKKDRYIEGSLKFFYVKGEGFRSSKIICKQGNKSVRTSLFNVLPTDVMLDIVDNKDTRFFPEDLVDLLKNKFSSIEEFSQWVKRNFKNRRK